MSSKALADGVDVGTVVAGTYKIVSILGRGGMGTVWEAHHQRLPGKRVAIKVLHPSVAEDADALARFRREAEIACRLGHPNIVEVHDFNSLEDGTPYLILELLEGESLDMRLRAGALGLDTCEQILRQIGSALQCAHEQGVVHRDLKPQNIFLVPSPTGVGPEIAKVLDFGISKIHGSQTVKTQESTLLGTPQYMAPEQATGQHDSVDATTDIFALAVMLYELLSERAAFPGLNIPEVVYKVVHVDPEPITKHLPELAPEKAAALHKAMSKSQTDRFASVNEFVLAFTGEDLAPIRARLTPAPSEIAEASTIASTKLAAGSAATVDSGKMDTPVGTGIDDIANANTVDSQKTDLVAAMAATIDSGAIDRKSTLMPAQVATPAATASTQMAAVPAPTRAPVMSTLLLAMAVIVALGAVAWIVIPADSSKSAAAPEPVAEYLAESDPVDTSGPALPSDTEAIADTEEVAPDDAVDPSMIDGAEETDEPPQQTPIEEEPEESTSAEVPIEKPVTPKNRRPTAGKPAPPPRPEKMAKLEALLKRAQSQLDAGDYKQAGDTAMRAYKIHRQSRSYAIKVKAMCHLSDLGNANGALRNIPKSNHGLRQSLQAYCKKLGQNLIL